MSASLLLLSALFLAGEGVWLDNTIGGLQLSLWALGIGGAAGFIGSLVVGRHLHPLLDGMAGPVARTVQFSFANALTLALVCLACASFSNRTWLGAETVKERVTVDKKSRSARGKHYVFFSLSNKVSERIEVDAGFFSRVEEGADMVITKQKGGLGFYVIRQWEPT